MTLTADTTVGTSLPVEIEATSNGLIMRWSGREVVLRGDRDELREYVEALAFCYEAGFDDASNPRLFVP